MSKHERYCLQCDDGTALVHGARDMVAAVDRVEVVVDRVRGWHCPVCGECEFDDGEGGRYSAALEAARERADRERIEEIRTIRKQLRLTQADAAELFGGGVNAFSEYERGKTRPHKATMVLLRLLGERPELLEDVRRSHAAKHAMRKQTQRLKAADRIGS